MRLLLIIACAIACVACSPRPQSAAASQPTSAATTQSVATPTPDRVRIAATLVAMQRAPDATATARPPTATPAPDYRAMRTRLLMPLSTLVVAVRTGDPNKTAAGYLNAFNAEADKILPAIERDGSKPANALHSAIVNVRTHPGNVAALEQDRLNLLADIP